MFLWHFPSGRPAWVLPSTVLCGARTFLGQPSTCINEAGLWEKAARDRLAYLGTYLNYSTYKPDCQAKANHLTKYPLWTII